MFVRKILVYKKANNICCIQFLIMLNISKTAVIKMEG